MVTPFKIDGVHSDPDVVADYDRRGPQFRARRAIFEKRCERLRVDQALRRFERMKIGIGDADVP